jgi:hypothetical protein
VRTSTFLRIVGFGIRGVEPLPSSSIILIATVVNAVVLLLFLLLMLLFLLLFSGWIFCEAVCIWESPSRISYFRGSKEIFL